MKRCESITGESLDQPQRIVILVLIGLLTPVSIATAVGAVSRGQAVYEHACIACHGAGGEGALPGVPDFTDPTGPLSKSDGLLIEHTINGFQSPGSPMAMPPRGGNPALTRDDIEQSLHYIRNAFAVR